jgi:hypothetical protein
MLYPNVIPCQNRQGLDLTVCSMGADYPKKSLGKRKDISVTKTIGGCIGEIQGFTAAQKKNRLVLNLRFRANKPSELYIDCNMESFRS